MTDLCKLCTELAIKKCPVAPGSCDLAPQTEAYVPIRVVTIEEARRRHFPAPRAGWCASDNIVLAQGPRKLRP